MKRLLFLVVSIFIYTNLVASEEKLLRTFAIFQTFPKESTIEFSDDYSQEEHLDSYVGRPVCEEVIIGRFATPAIKQLVGFIGASGKRYTCAAYPVLKKGEFLLIARAFKESSQYFLMKKEREDRNCGCVWGRESVSFEHGKVELELEKIKKGSNK